MSYAFDVQRRAWNRIANASRSLGWEASFLFEQLFEAMHTANHMLNDAINHDRGVTRAAEELEAWLEANPEPAPTPSEYDCVVCGTHVSQVHHSHYPRCLKCAAEAK